MRQNKTNKENQRLTDGRYVYYCWEEETQRKVPIYLTPDEDGVTEEILIILEDMDHDEDLQERYTEENRDYCTENQKVKYVADSEESIGDPIENLATVVTNPEFILEQEEMENPQVQQLLELMQKLTPQQIDLIYALFGELKSMADIAREQGKTRQAVNNQKNKIINRLKKLFEADEML